VLSTKRIISVFLLTLLSIPFYYKMGFLVYFTLNKEAIIKEFCVNKANTKLKCDGKCYLKKKLNPEQSLAKNDLADKEDKSLLPVIKEIKNLKLIYIIPSGVTFSKTYFYNNKIAQTEDLISHNYLSKKGRLHHNNIFHPPLC